ncbi:ZIP family metal transporter [Halobellus litoreus]|uniref:ZIP family metal transporter n=1 Tax=Halobellus litoreus TaxID=755310 RepID=A0ABD6DVE0_9EURY|nr:ZIP family metal transporter [Halobellus litoreus]
MNAFGSIVLATFGISLTAWIGLLALYFREELLERILLGLVALAAGSLLGGAFLHLLPSAIAETGPDETVPLFLYLLGGFCSFYVLEQFLHWHHQHTATHERQPISYLVLVSDTIHNFIDGLVIAGSFLVGAQIGIVTTLAIALHEVPQEIGDFGVLVYGGFERRRALVLNYLTQSTVVLGGVTGFFLGDLITGVPAVLLPFAAGNFIYIASSDLIPEIKQEEDLLRSSLHFLVFLTGIALMFGIRVLRGVLG